MAAVKKFLDNVDSEKWKLCIDKYDDILKAKCKTKSKPAAAKELKELDDWYQNDLPGVIQERSEKYMTHEELVKLMKWKLSRGKFRPRLVALAESNSEEDVTSKSKAAFKKAGSGKIKAAIECLTPLKGIGPATASAVLAAGCPETSAFMADEPTGAILGSAGLKYTLPEYLAYNEGVVDCLKQLQQQDGDFGWTAHKVELALWTFCMADKLSVDISDNNNKRKSLEDGDAKAKKKKT